MKRVDTRADGWTLEVSRQEKELLLQVLVLYPVIPVSHHNVTRGALTPQLEESQRVLDAALADRRSALQTMLRTTWFTSARFTLQGKGFRVSLSHAELEELLEALNDVRVGSWLKLGSPDAAKLATLGGDEKLTPWIVAMELCGYFQSALLDAVDDAPQ